MKTVYLLRHAKSSWEEPGQHDHERPLNARGQKACAVMGEFIRQQGIAPAVVLCSDAVRTRQTWEGIREFVGGKPQVIIDRGLYDAPAAAVGDAILAVDPEAPSVMVIGHNPGIEELARALVRSGPADDRERLKRKYPTAGLAEIAFDGDAWAVVDSGKGRLVRFVTPGSRGGDDD